MEYEFRINGKLYCIVESNKGWSWEQITSDYSCIDQQQGFSETAADAQQDAIRFAQSQAA